MCQIIFLAYVSELSLSLQENPGSEPFGNVLQGVQVVSDPTRAALPDPPAARQPALGQSTVDNLRRLANRYVNHPESQIDMVRMEPGSAGRYKVVIVLEMADFL